MDYYAIGQRIRKIRKARNLSQEQLSEMVGISITHMSLSLPVLVDLANALEVRTDDLLYDKVTAERSTATDTIVQLLEACTTQQLRVIEDLVKAAKASLSQHF